MTISVGDRLPDVPLSIATPDGPQPTTSSEYFAGKRVALFAGGIVSLVQVDQVFQSYQQSRFALLQPGRQGVPDGRVGGRPARVGRPKPGMTGEVKVIVAKLDGVLNVPVQAVGEREGKSVAYVVGPRGVECR